MNTIEKRATLKLGRLFLLKYEGFGKITGLYAKGMHYHTLDFSGNCIKGQQYISKSNFKALQV
jgi:hypothetical protein